ncbi:MAG: hypothetical protein IPL46_12615 [Saprospiraceae bacterium]|nr:hypothetical protein [Saprospiraceae bacterium]
MKNILLAVFMAILGISAGAQATDQVTVPLSSPGKIGLLATDLKSASIKVTGSNRSDILVKYRLVENLEDDEDNEMEGNLKRIKTNNFDFEISEEKNTVSIKSESWFQQIELEIEVPNNFNLDLHNYTGRFIEVNNISGDINLESYTGYISAKAVSGTVNASTYAGKIEVAFKQITPDQSMAFSNYSGTIDLTLPANYKATFKMKTSFSEVYSAFDMNVVSKPAELKKVEGNTFKLSTDEWTVGSINGGGPEIMIKNFSGGIYLRKA